MSVYYKPMYYFNLFKSMRFVWNAFRHFEHLENQLYDVNSTLQPIRGNISHVGTDALLWSYSVVNEIPLHEIISCVIVVSTMTK